MIASATIRPAPSWESAQTSLALAAALLGKDTARWVKVDTTEARIEIDVDVDINIEAAEGETGQAGKANDIALVSALTAERLSEREAREAAGAKKGLMIEMRPAPSTGKPERWLGVIASGWYAATPRKRQAVEERAAQEVWRTARMLAMAIQSFAPLETPDGPDDAPLYAISAEEGKPRVRALCPFSLNANAQTAGTISALTRRIAARASQGR